MPVEDGRSEVVRDFGSDAGLIYYLAAAHGCKWYSSVRSHQIDENERRSKMPKVQYAL